VRARKAQSLALARCVQLHGRYGVPICQRDVSIESAATLCGVIAPPFVEHLSLERRAQLRRIGALLISRRLDWLARWYGTDKGPSAHGYTVHYQRHLGTRRREHLTILEIGVGGDETNTGGVSLRMWRSFFPAATIIGADLYSKQLPPERRITIVQGDQGDTAFLDDLGRRFGPFDVVIDDGSHRGEDIVASFDALWPQVRQRGLYVIEDLQTAYDPAYGGGPPDTPGTSMALLKRRLDDAQITDRSNVHVYHGIAFIERAARAR
jgi:demethylmacrocin O-methyltransferase